MADTGRLASDRRGISQTVAYVLLIALVLAGALVTVAVGSQAIGDVRSDNSAKSASTGLQEVDSRLATLVASDDAPRTTFELRRLGEETVSAVDSGYLNVTVNDDPSCSTRVNLTAIRYERGGEVVAYEGGGVWRRSPGDESAVVTAPDVTFRRGVLDVRLVALNGTVDPGRNVARLNVSASRRATEAAGLALSNCRRFERVTVTVRSGFHRAWGRYLADETGGTLYDDADTTAPETVRVVLDDDDLPGRVDFDRNPVVNLSAPPYMRDVTIGTDSVSVDKGANNTYVVSVKPVREEPPEIGRVSTLAATNVSDTTRGAFDVVFVMDESGSMAGTKIAEARDAARAAVGTMNTSTVGDRASVAGYTAYADQRYVGADERLFSNDSAAIDATIGDLSAGGNTDLAAGLNASLAALSTRDSDRPAYVFLLTDGQNSPGYGKCGRYSHPALSCDDYFDERTRNAADLAASRDVTVYTFGYGAGADGSLLEEVARETGGNYTQAADGDELASVFRATISNISRGQKFVTRTPLSTNLTGAGGSFPPEIVGDTDAIARYSVNGRTFLNVNDPTAPTLFGHSFAVEDDESVSFNATTFECAEWAATGDLERRDGTSYPVARCAEIEARNASLRAENVTVNTTGQDADWLMTGPEINASLDPYVDNTVDEFRLDSNQAVVTLDFPDSPDSENHLVLVYEVGLAEAEFDSADVVGVSVDRVEIG